MIRDGRVGLVVDEEEDLVGIGEHLAFVVRSEVVKVLGYGFVCGGRSVGVNLSNIKTIMIREGRSYHRDGILPAEECSILGKDREQGFIGSL